MDKVKENVKSLIDAYLDIETSEGARPNHARKTLALPSEYNREDGVNLKARREKLALITSFERGEHGFEEF